MCFTACRPRRVWRAGELWRTGNPRSGSFGADLVCPFRPGLMVIPWAFRPLDFCIGFLGRWPQAGKECAVGAQSASIGQRGSSVPSHGVAQKSASVAAPLAKPLPSQLHGHGLDVRGSHGQGIFADDQDHQRSPNKYLRLWSFYEKNLQQRAKAVSRRLATALQDASE